MKITIVLLMTLLQPIFASVHAPDLCADVLRKTTGEPITDAAGTNLARFCDWTGPTVPVWKGDVCCTIDDQTASCSVTNSRGTCDSGVKRYCEYGEAITGAGFVCYQPLPSACTYGGCATAGTIQAPANVEEDLLCCENGDCFEFTSPYLEDCLGYFSYCLAGYLNEDGTVDCYD